MKIFRHTLLLLLVAVTAQALAQRRLVVVDVETLIPVSGANVVSADGNTTTDSLGYFSVSDSCRTLAFSHVTPTAYECDCEEGYHWAYFDCEQDY